MQQSKSRFLLWPALGAALVLGGIATQVQAEGSSPPSEVKRGVPGVDVDVNRKQSGGVDVDVQAGKHNDNDKALNAAGRNTRALGASSDTQTTETKGGRRAPTQDRN